MKTIRTLLMIFLLLLIASNAFAVGTITASAEKVSDLFGTFKFVKVTLTCTGDSGAGTYPATVVNTLSGVSQYPLTGLKLYMVQAYPGNVPTTDATDLTITMDGVDILGARGTNLIDATSKTSCLAGTADDPAPIPITGNITVNITNNVVNSANPTIILTFVSE